MAEIASREGLLALASNILEQTQLIKSYLESNDLSEPTFEPDTSTPPSDPKYQAIRSSLVDSLDDLRRLVTGPWMTLRSLLCEGNDLAAFHVAFEFDMFNVVPVDSGMEVQDLADKIGLHVDRTARVMRMLATHRVFREARPGYFVHTAASALYYGSKNENTLAAGHYTVDDMWVAATGLAPALKEAPFESDNDHCGFNKAHGAPMFQFYGKNPHRATRFAKAMAGITVGDRPITELRDAFDWSRLQGKVVDVGGGSGHVSMTLARSFPNVNFVVQDLSEDMIAAGKLLDSSDIEGRVSYMKHSFFDPQPVTDASAFFIRQCTHNWCDRDVVRIFKAMVPGLEASGPGTPFLINETVMPEPGTIARSDERSLRQMDMLMMIALGAKQRTQKELEALLKEADPRFEVCSAHVEGSMGLLEVQLKT